MHTTTKLKQQSNTVNGMRRWLDPDDPKLIHAEGQLARLRVERAIGENRQRLPHNVRVALAASLMSEA